MAAALKQYYFIEFLHILITIYTIYVITNCLFVYIGSINSSNVKCCSKNSTLHRRPLLPKGQRKGDQSQHLLLLSLTKCKKQKQWRNKVMEAAISSVIDENTPILRAARKHGIPKSTLHDRISEKVEHGKKPGPKQLLSAAEEEFSSFLIEVSQAGYGKTRKEVKNVAGMVAVDKGRRSKPIVSDGWF